MKPSIFERILDRLFEYQEIRAGCEAIGDATQPLYLKRYFLVQRADPSRSAGIFHLPRFSLTVRPKSEGWQLYLHKICRSDADREQHDHPWSFVSLILWRGYREETQQSPCFCDRLEGWRHEHLRVRRKWPGMVLFRDATHRHRVLIGDGPAWTLVLTSARKRSWGFWSGSLFTPWREFIARKCKS